MTVLDLEKTYTVLNIEESNESHLVRLAQEGDENALNQLLRENYDRIFSICRRLAGNDADANDATQEALFAIVRKLSTFKGEARFSTWAYRVATNACLDEIRKRNRRPRPGLIDIDQSRSLSGNIRQSMEDQITDRLLIDEAIAALPDEFRIPIILRDQVGMDYNEIAKTLSLPPGTVKSRIARGRARLKSQIFGNKEETSNVKGLEYE